MALNPRGARRPALRSRHRRDGGVALLLALLVLVILAIIIVQMTVTSLHTKTVADNHVGDLQNTYGVRAGYHQGVLFLRSDLDQGGDVDSLSERWAQPIEFDLGRAHVRVAIQDSDRFISLAQLVNDKGEPNPTVVAQLKRLVRILRHPPEVADRIIDYIDGDSKGAFEARARNERLFNLEEMLRIEGIAPEVVYGGAINGEEKKGLAPFLTAWPPSLPQGVTAGQVNVNTAPAEVLQALAEEMTSGAAEAIVAWRAAPGPDGKPQSFQKVEDVKKVPGVTGPIYDAIAPQLTVKASTFEIRVRSQAGTLEKAWTYCVRRAGGAQPGMTLLGSERLSDFLTVKPEEEKK
jgi:general secretion pathway protein K